ncbi:hypothetical protein FS749_012181 [Ceratobasidium sp. UAMH 11750]|nr:hypothetical protein FS749_012181 [Ceratobasidium sp. UAMH 11750]
MTKRIARKVKDIVEDRAKPNGYSVDAGLGCPPTTPIAPPPAAIICVPQRIKPGSSTTVDYGF